MKNIKYYKRVILIYAFLFLISIIVFIIFLNKYHIKTYTSYWSESHLHFANEINNELELQFSCIKNELELIAKLPEFHKIKPSNVKKKLNGTSNKSDSLKRYLFNEILDKNKNLSALFILDKQGTMYLLEPYDIQLNISKINFSERKYFQAVNESKTTYFSENLRGANGEKVIVIATPILDSNHNVHGLICGVINVDKITSYLLKNHLGKNDFSYIVDQSNKVIAKSSEFSNIHLKQFINIKNASNSEYIFTSKILFNNWTLYFFRNKSIIQDIISPRIKNIIIAVALLFIMFSLIGIIGVRNIGIKLFDANKKLQKSHKILDKAVKVRTKSLEEINDKLQQEILQGKISKQKLIEINAELNIKEEEIRATYEELMASNDALKESYDRLEKAKEKAEEGDNLKSAFLANISHEIKTPMNSIIGFTELLKNRKLSNEKRDKYIEIVQSSTNQLLNIINDILSFSKIETGQFEIKLSEFDLNKLFNQLETQFFLLKKQQNKDHLFIETLKSIPDTEFKIISYESGLRQVLTNLIGNAVKYTKKGKITFSYAKRENDILFYVKDTGIGIPKNKIDIIFERFYQIDAILAREYGGAGLGLSISKGIVELLDGEIWVESSTGENSGSCFYFTIPLKHSE